MRIVARWRARLRAVFKRDALDREIERELGDWVDELTARFQQTGLSPVEARRRALVETGGITQVKEQVYGQRPGAGVETIVQDIRTSWRSLRRSRGFTTAAVVTMAMGIAANTVVFSVVHGVLLSPLPYPQSDRLTMIWREFSQNLQRGPLAPIDVAAMRQAAPLYQSIGGIWPVAGTLLSGGEPEPVRVGRVTANFLEVLGVSPLRGRWLTVADEHRGPTGMVISAALWRSRFGGDEVIGRQVRMRGGWGFGGGDYTIVGIMPPEFEMLLPFDTSVPRSVDVWVPFDSLTGSGASVRTVGRLAPGATVAAASAQVEAFARASKVTTKFHHVGLHEDLVKDARQPLVILQVAVAFLLLIACISVATLTLVRAQGRQREMAIRVAIGARPLRLMRLLLTEGVMLGAMGGLGGVGLAWLALQLLPRLDTGTLLRSGIALTPAVLACAAGASLTAAFIFTVTPLIGVGRMNLDVLLRGAGRATSGIPRQRVRNVLVVAEIALSVALLVGAGLLIRTFLNLLAFNPGFRSEQVMTFRLTLPGDQYNDKLTPPFASEFERRLRGLPGVDAVGIVNLLPLDDEPNYATSFWSGETLTNTDQPPLADVRLVTPGYFETLRVELVGGRFFTERDNGSQLPVVIIDERLARTAFADGNAVGRDLKFSSRDAQWSRVVGVVRHLRQHRLAEEVREQVFMPMAQRPRNQMSVVVRSTIEPGALMRSIAQEMKQIDASLAPGRVRPLEALTAKSRAPARFSMLLTSLFACVSLALACQSLYGVIAYSVAQRTSELGVRAAIGATAKDLVTMVALEGVLLIALGVALGLAGSTVLAGGMQGLLFGIAAIDPATFVVVPIAVALTALAACLGPAWRAGRVDPIVALRSD